MNGPTTAPKLGVQGLTHRFEIGDERKSLTVLSDIDLAILRGQFVCIIGESGCGKSTLLRMMAGLLTPSEGKVLHDGVPIRGVNQALDVQTKATMQEAVLKLWESTQKTVVFVTHDLDEAVFLADVVVVLSSRPGRVHAIIDNPLRRPRDEATRVSDEFAAAKRALWVALQDARAKGAAAPALPPAAALVQHAEPNPESVRP